MSIVFEDPNEYIFELKEYYFHRCDEPDLARWTEFETRIIQSYSALKESYFSVYQADDAFACKVFRETLSLLVDYWVRRSNELKLHDVQRQKDPDWINSERMFGASCYVDRFANSLPGLLNRTGYLKDIGVTYLYILPIFKKPLWNNDGGFAVSSYRELDSNLGSVEDFEKLASCFREQGISLAVDLVLNHTSDEHEWAKKAKAGDLEYLAYYHFFEQTEVSLVESFNKLAHNPFPLQGPVLEYHQDINGYVWSSFYGYQWDLNYGNPAVFKAMAGNVFFLINCGVDIIRLDAIPFVWKRLETDCTGQPECVFLVECFKLLATMLSPCVRFKSEVIMVPEAALKYIGNNLCDIAYRPTLTSLLWEALATGNSEFLAYSVKKWHRMPNGACWLNYVTHHDDISWCFSDEDFSVLRYGMAPASARKRLQNFYTQGQGSSFARGVGFQVDADTGAGRICGTLASLAGLEEALNEANVDKALIAVKRIGLLHSVICSVGGLPMIFLGDEMGVLNDYSYLDDDNLATDSRWVHRPVKDWTRDESLLDNARSVSARIYKYLQRLVQIRRENSAFAGVSVSVVASESPSIFAYIRGAGENRILVLANFSRSVEVVARHIFTNLGFSGRYFELISGRQVAVDDGVTIPGYGTLWLKRSLSET